jgi:hypothetical protein
MTLSHCFNTGRTRSVGPTVDHKPRALEGRMAGEDPITRRAAAAATHASVTADGDETTPAHRRQRILPRIPFTPASFSNRRTHCRVCGADQKPATLRARGRMRRLNRIAQSLRVSTEWFDGGSSLTRSQPGQRPS